MTANVYTLAWFIWTSWSKCSYFLGLAAVFECDLSLTLLLPLQKWVTHCVHIQCLVSSILQVSMNVSACNLFHMDKFNYIHSHFAQLCALAFQLSITRQKIRGYWQEGSTFVAIPPKCFWWRTKYIFTQPLCMSRMWQKVSF